MMRLKKINKFVIISLIFFNFCIAQIDTESMRNDSNSLGIKNKLSLNYSLEKSRDETVQFETKYRMDYSINKNLLSFFIINYKNSYKKKDNNNNQIVNKGFGHLRIIKKIKPIIFVELFGQYGFNDFLLIEDRRLTGIGVRLRLKENIFSGIGFMNEIEEYNNLNENINLIRSTNYLTINSQLKENISITNTGYLQIDISNLNDFRILNNFGLKIDLTENLNFSIKFNYRYDNDPHDGANKEYINITNGIAYKF